MQIILNDKSERFEATAFQLFSSSSVGSSRGSCASLVISIKYGNYHATVA